MNTGDHLKPTVKDKLLDALVSLIKENEWSSISVSKLITEAGVARASFYRNFNTIEDVIFYGIDHTIAKFRIEAKDFPNHQTDPDYVYFSFVFYQQNAELILAFHHAQFHHSLLRVMNDFIVETYGDMPAHSIERYNLYFYTGAFYNMAITWLESGAQESAEDMAETYIALTRKSLA